jgi:hypothetical protein
LWGIGGAKIFYLKDLPANYRKQATCGWCRL